MNSILSCCLIAGCLLIAGCSAKIEQRVPVELAPPTPLPVAEWKAMTDIDLKYDLSTLERLRLNDPRLQNENLWNAYMKQVVVPERKKDIPTLGVAQVGGRSH